MIIAGSASDLSRILLQQPEDRVWRKPSELRRNRVWFEAPRDFLFVDQPRHVQRLQVIGSVTGNDDRVWGFIRLRTRQRIDFFHKLLPDVEMGDGALYTVRRTDPSCHRLHREAPSSSWRPEVWTDMVRRRAEAIQMARTRGL